MKNKVIFLIMLVSCLQLIMSAVALAEHYTISGTSTTVNQTFKNFNETSNGGVF